MRWLMAACAVGPLMLLAASAIAGPTVTEQFGNILYHSDSGSIRPLTSAGNFGQPVLGPDGRTVAFVHIDGPGEDVVEGEPTSLWIADGPTGMARKLIGFRPSDDPHERFSGISSPIFSLDGNFIYVTGAMAVVSPGVHQVNIKTGQQRFVIGGAAVSVIRTGPYRGYLLVGRHMYFDPPRVGSYNAVYVVQPDGKVMFMVPGSDADDARDHIRPWLQAKGWKAW